MFDVDVRQFSPGSIGTVIGLSLDGTDNSSCFQNLIQHVQFRNVDVGIRLMAGANSNRVIAGAMNTVNTGIYATEVNSCVFIAPAMQTGLTDGIVLEDDCNENVIISPRVEGFSGDGIRIGAGGGSNSLRNFVVWPFFSRGGTDVNIASSNSYLLPNAENVFHNDVKTDHLRAFSLRTALGSELTVASGAITVRRGYHTVDTQGNDPSDDLDTIRGGVDGMRLILRSSVATRTVVARNGTGNLLLTGDFSMDHCQDTIELIYDTEIDVGGKWLELSRSNNGI